MPDDLTVTGASSGDAGSAASPSSEDERIKGLQRAVSEKAREAEESRRVAADLQRQIEELRVAQMSEPERQAYHSTREQQELQRARAEIERLKLAQKYPDVAQSYEALLNARTAEEQALILRGLLNPKAASAADEPVSDVDPNNPMRPANSPIGLPPVESAMTADLALQILKAHGNRPLRS